MYLVGLIVPKEEIIPKINTAMERTFAPQVVEYLWEVLEIKEKSFDKTTIK